MRTKNGKRIGPVPITLVAVFALAAFLSVGLLLTTSAQPAAAQSDDADCTIVIDKDGDGAATIDVTAAATDGDPATDTVCDAHGDTATVEFVGDSRATEDHTLSVLIAEKDGPITAYPNGTVWDGAPDNRLEAADGTVASPAKYRFVSVTVPKRAQNAQGVLEGQKVTITVKGDVSIWIGAVSVTAPITGIPSGNAASGARAVIASPAAPLDITFLGMPALGKDLATDYNTKLDDDVMLQCVVDDTDDTNDRKLVGEHATDCELVDPPGTPVAGAWDDSTLVTDVPESRSKLVVRTNGAAPVITPVIDGKKATATLSADDHTSFTVYALVEDKDGEGLEDTEVLFTATDPADIVPRRDLVDDPKTKPVAAAAATGAIVVTGLTAADTPPTGAIIETGDAVAAYTLDNLPTDTSFKITVEVMVGDLSLGTVEVVRPGDPETLMAGVFNIECFDKGDEDDYSDATFDAENDDCDDSGMARRFGADERIVVKAHLEDSLGNVVGASGDLSAKLADSFDDPLIAGNPVTIVNPVKDKTMPRAWVYTVDEDAMLGDHMIEVSTTAKDGDNNAIASVTLTVTVAGPPVEYTVSPMGTYHTTGSRVTFTVSALDENDGVPHFTTMDDATTMNVDERNHRVLIDAIYGTLRGVDEDDYLILDTDTGMKTFTFTLPRDARANEEFEITVGEGDMAQTVTVVYGEETDPPADELTAPTNVVANSFGTSGTVGVTWKPVAAAAQHIVALMSNDGLTIVDIEYLTAEDNRHTFRDVDPGDYRVIVVAASADGVFMLSKQDMVTVR